MSQNMYFAEDIKRINNNYKVTDNTTIFRYMEFTKFMDLLENKKLFFCNSDYFEDGYEGIMPDGFYNKWTCSQRNSHKKVSAVINEVVKAYINCWNVGENESYALWKIYTAYNSGVAIKSTVGRLKEALCNEEIEIYKVEYIKTFDDLSEDKEPPFYYRVTNSTPQLQINKRVKEVYKLDSYSYENEIRAVYIDNSNDKGISFDVDLNILINEIYISPFSSDWFYDLIRKIISRKNYNI